MISLSFAIVMVLGSLTTTGDRSVAEPTVLYDSGEGVSIEPYLEPLAPKKTLLEAPTERPEFSVGGFGLPVRTPSMTPGKVERRTIPAFEGKMVGASPLFIIGADRWSLQWLQQNRAHLIGMNAAGVSCAGRQGKPRGKWPARAG